MLSIRDSLQAGLDTFVRVTADAKVPDEVSAKQKLKNLLRMTGVGTRAMKVWLWFECTPVNSATGTFQAPVFRIRPSDSTEFSALSDIFDEYRCEEVKTRTAISFSLGIATVAVRFSMAYDPLNNGAYTGLAAPLPAVYHLGPICCHNSNSNPITMTPDGYQHLNFKIPTGPTNEATGVSITNTGNWTDSGTTAADYGFLKYYVTAPTAGVLSTVSPIIGMLVHFRMRS
jgi:hypothetical protein